MATQEASPVNTAEILSLASSGQENFVPAAEEAAQEAPHTFLSLAPTTSASYPTSPLAKSPVQTPSANSTTQESLDALLLKTRRSSSLASDASGNASVRRRFLKLGPVHFGEGDGDWSEDVVEG